MSRCARALLALALALAIAAAAKPPTPARLRADGDAAFVKQDFAGALKLFTEAATLEPGNPQNYYKRYRVNLRQLNYRKAAADLGVSSLAEGLARVFLSQ